MIYCLYKKVKFKKYRFLMITKKLVNHKGGSCKNVFCLLMRRQVKVIDIQKYILKIKLEL